MVRKYKVLFVHRKLDTCILPTAVIIPIHLGQKWYNELNSTMIIKSYDEESGVFSGKYESLVGVALRFYVLTGRRNTEGNTIGWTVNWQNKFLNAHSVTTWSGQLQLSPCGDPMILTTWLLTTQTEPEKNWKVHPSGTRSILYQTTFTGKQWTCIVQLLNKPPQDCMKMNIQTVIGWVIRSIH